MTEPTSPPRAQRLGEQRPGARTMFVRDLMVDCSIGVHRHERAADQRVRINLELEVCDDRAVGDNIANVISYDDIVAGVKAVARAGHVNLVETLAERVADFCVSDPRVVVARVRVEKLDVIAEAASVGVEIERLNPLR